MREWEKRFKDPFDGDWDFASMDGRVLCAIIEEIVADAVSAEREACAAKLEGMKGEGRDPSNAWADGYRKGVSDTCLKGAAAIRARGVS